MKEIAEYLESMRWRVSRQMGETIYYSPDDEQVVVLGDWWELRSFTDSDKEVDDIERAVGRYEFEAEGSTLAELREAMLGVAA